jgi:hypothetical protein
VLCAASLSVETMARLIPTEARPQSLRQSVGMIDSERPAVA